MKLLAISGSLTRPSRTVEALRLALDGAVAYHPGVEAEILDPRAYEVVFCDGRNPDDYTGDTRTVIDLVAAADAYVVGSPLYRGSYTGALKNLFDLVPNSAPRGKVAGIVVTGGSDHHFLAVEHQMRPLLSFFQMHTVPGAVYAQNTHFQDGRLVDAAVRDACGRLGADVVRLYQALEARESGAHGPAYPTIQRKPGE